MTAGATGRNDRCPCGSGRKFKHCCGVPGGTPPLPAHPPGPSHASPSPVSQGIARTLAARPGAIRDGRTATAASMLAEAAALRAQGRLAQAAATLHGAVELYPRSAECLHALGIALEEGGDRGGAIACYERATAILPRLADAQERLGTLLNLAGRREEAVARLHRAAAAAPGTAQGRVCLARAHLLEDNLAGAEAALRQAVALSPASAQASRMLGSVLSILGRFDEASRHFQRAIQSDPGDVTAYLGLARTRTITAADDPLIAGMERCVASPGLPAPQRMTLFFALGKAFEDLGDWPAAWSHFQAANRLRAQAGRLDHAACAARVDRIIATFGPEAFEAASRADPRDTPPGPRPILIVGMPRSGTTLVEQIVSSHPDVAGGGELRHWTGLGGAWDRGGQGLPGRDALAGMARSYEALLDGLAVGRCHVTDKNPFNFLWLGLVRLALPHAVIVHCRRDPIDTCLSIYKTQFATPLDFAGDLQDLGAFYRQYERLMAHWRSVFGQPGFLEVDYENLVRDGAPAIRAFVERCGLPWSERCLRPELNLRPVRTASLWQARQPIYAAALGRWHHYRPWLGPLIASLGGTPGKDA